VIAEIAQRDLVRVPEVGAIARDAIVEGQLAFLLQLQRDRTGELLRDRSDGEQCRRRDRCVPGGFARP